MYAGKSHPILRIVVFDMDGVLVDVKSSWQFIHDAFGADNHENVKRCEAGKITYRELMRRDIALWGRVHISKIRDILYGAPLMPGATETIARLREAGLKTGLISAGVSILADRLQAVLGLDYVYANKVLTDEQGFLTGEGREVVGLMNKLNVLRKMAAIEKALLRECVAVGDSLYDIPMFRKAGLSIAFNSEDMKVKKAADVAVETKDLRDILPCLVKTPK